MGVPCICISVAAAQVHHWVEANLCSNFLI